ncbi:MAG: hypothetical protein GTO53_07275 [Planctomycetales bacterium]|nr:hypothetical protein [Planctomycetales bacterium]NIM08936.1 hypothetical protein [Planctomycetales bacterium]NIN08406.1 hypothetical protein [Planctomycetales bacterium]NIN77534.1 hypothetical protein [Planctomycetales bacterium]NIO34706.1 hypothetical protein [Planctomycetales bacterium]
MVFHIKSTIIIGILAFVSGFCFLSGAYVAHDLWRTVDDENVVWLVNRIAAGFVITMFVILGVVSARGIEYLVVRWWKSRHPQELQEDD